MLRVLLPCHTDMCIADPLSVCGDFQATTVPKWKFVTTVLDEKNITNIDGLLDAIENLQPTVDTRTLGTFLKDTWDAESFLKKIPGMIRIALKLPELFKSCELDVLQPGETSNVSYTREQVACLIANMFFCSLQPADWNKYWVNFSIWYNSQSPPVIAYLKTLFTYFEQLDEDGVPEEPHRRITFSRIILNLEPDWISASHELATVKRGVGYEPREYEAQVDFANKDIGFGVSGTQEEALFGMSPEMSIAMLIAPTMADNETIIIRGAEIIGRYSGFGQELKFIGPWEEQRDWRNRYVIAMDALELDTHTYESEEVEIPDLIENNMKRELNKCFCGFQAFKIEDFPTIVEETSKEFCCKAETVGASKAENETNKVPNTALSKRSSSKKSCRPPATVTIATGHWGCGSFGGNKQVKSLIQLMAASISKTTLTFYDIARYQSGEKTFMAEFLELASFLNEKSVTVQDLYRALVRIGENVNQKKIEKSDVFAMVTDYF